MPVIPLTPRSGNLDIHSTQHTLYTHGMSPPWFWCDPDDPERLSGETRNPLEKIPAFLVYPIDVRRKGVAQWNFLLGCDGLVPRNTQNLDPPQLLHRFSLFRPKWGFRRCVRDNIRDIILCGCRPLFCVPIYIKMN